jgi:hypothetical protein
VLLLLPASMFVYSSCGSESSSLSCGVFLPLLLSQAFPLLVAGCMLLLPPETLQPGLACLFTVLGRILLPSSSELRAPHPFCHVSLLFLLLKKKVSLFSPGGCRSVQGAILIWPRVVCESTAYRLACPHLPKLSGCR